MNYGYYKYIVEDIEVIQENHINPSHWKRVILESGPCYLIDPLPILGDLCSVCSEEPSGYFIFITNSPSNWEMN